MARNGAGRDAVAAERRLRRRRRPDAPPPSDVHDLLGEDDGIDADAAHEDLGAPMSPTPRTARVDDLLGVDDLFAVDADDADDLPDVSDVNDDDAADEDLDARSATTVTTPSAPGSHSMRCLRTLRSADARAVRAARLGCAAPQVDAQRSTCGGHADRLLAIELACQTQRGAGPSKSVEIGVRVRG